MTDKRNIRMEILPVKHGKFGQQTTYNSVVVHTLEAVTSEGQFMMTIIEKHAMVAGKPDGEDTSGRQKLALTPIEELVDRSAKLARKTFDRMREEGWMVEIPDQNKLGEMINRLPKEKDDH